MEEQRNRLRPWRPPQQFAHGQYVFFSLASCGAGAFLTLPRGKPDHTAAERRSISAFQNCFGDQRNSGVAEHRQVISTGRPDTLFMWGLQLGGDYTASWRDNAALTACWNISRPGLQGPSASLPSSCWAQPTAPIWCAAAKRCLMASLRSETGGS